MKFKCKLFDVGAISQFHHLVGTISKFCKTCCLKLAEDKLYFILNERLVSGGTSLWCEVNQKGFFDDFRIEGKDSTGLILMSLNPDNLAKSLANTTGATSVKMKLAKKQTACLSIDITLPTGSSIQRLITHDVPIHLIPLSHWDNYEEPDMPHFDVSIYLPQLRRLKTVLERLKNLSSNVTMKASWKGSMSLSINSDLVSIKTLFSNLDTPQLPAEEMRNTRDAAEVTVDIKKLLTFIQAHNIGNARAIANIVHNKALQLFLIQDDVQLQYYLPSIDFM